MKKNHHIAKSAYMRSLLGKDMEGFKPLPEILRQFQLYAPRGQACESIATEVMIKQEKKTVFVSDEEQIATVQTLAGVLSELGSVFNGDSSGQMTWKTPSELTDDEILAAEKRFKSRRKING